MPDIELTDQEMQMLMHCVNQRVEPPEELAKKLFPKLYASFDFKKLNRASIPTIEYAGKRSEAAILNEASAFGSGSPLQPVRFFHAGKQLQQTDMFAQAEVSFEAGWKNMIVQGDNLQFLKTCFLDQDPIVKGKVKGKVKAVIMDPPFATRADFHAKDGQDSYSDKVDRAEFIEAMRERLVFIRELLAADGSVFVHLDPKMSHFMKVVLDEIFGPSFFRNEIIWYYFNKMQGNINRFASNHDTILWYSRGANYTFHKQQEDRGRTVKQIKRVWDKEKSRLVNAKDADGRVIYIETDVKTVDDVWQLPMLQPADKIEVQGYPTQKPEALVSRIILASTDDQDLVLDPFGGSGTTAAVAEKLGRRWVTCDFGKHAVYTMQRRIACIAESLTPGTEKSKKMLYGKPPHDFCVVSVGAFDFSRIMDLRKNRDAYIAFVLGVFGISDRNEQFSKKYQVSNVVAEKEGNPVEVYPVWEDDYLRKVKVDEDYLKGILEQSGGKLKGDYYIVSPESCVRVGTSTVMKNAKGEKVTFRMLTFPYKVLEDAARNFQICEQPSAPENINRLISSVGFYFHEEVEIKLKKTAKGFKVTEFKTSILNANDERYEGLDGLAMILVDTGHDGETFDVNACVYLKDLKDGEVAIKDVTGKTAVIAVDKHGNESKITLVK